MSLLDKLFYWYTFIFAKSKLYKINAFLFHLGLRGMGIYNSENLLISGELTFLKTYLNRIKSPMILDIGANEGKYTKTCKKISPNARIISFEPHPKTFMKLRRNVKDTDIILINKALSENSGESLLYDYEGNDGSTHASLQKNVIERVHGKKSICHNVNVTTIDTIIKEFNIVRIDLLKIDVEGNEISVLKGANESLKNNIIEAIQFEFTQINSTSRIFMKEFFDLLNDKYILHRLLPREMLSLNEYDPTMHEIFGYQNIVALKR